MRSIFILLFFLIKSLILALPKFDRNLERHYRFDGVVISGLTGSASPTKSQTKISARVRMQDKAHHTILMQLVDIEISTEIKDVKTETDEYKISKDHVRILELPVAVKKSRPSHDFSGKRITFHTSDVEWSRNIKKSIVNLIWEDLTNFESRTVREKTIEGSCESTYIINQDPDPENGTYYITKLVKFDETSEEIHHQTVYNFEVAQDGFLEEAKVRSIYSYKDVLETETRASLKFEEEHSIINEIRMGRLSTEEIEYESESINVIQNFYENGTEYPFPEWMKTLPNQNTTIENVDEFVRLVQMLRILNYDDLKGLKDSIFVENETADVFYQALTATNTFTPINFLIDNLDRENNPLMFAQIIRSIQQTPLKSNEIAQKLLTEQYYSSISQRMAWFASASIVNKHDYEWLKMVENAFHKFHNSIDVKIIVVKTLGNIENRNAKSLDFLISLIKDHREELIVRREAIEALRFYDSPEVHYFFISFFQNQENVPELRMTALNSLMKRKPEKSILLQIALLIDKERNKEVKYFAFSMLKRYSKKQRDQQFASDCKDVLAFVEYYEDEELLSKIVGMLFQQYVHLPSFLEIDYDLVLIQPMKSQKLCSYQLSIDVKIEGKWIDNFIEIGIVHQTSKKIESYLYGNYKGEHQKFHTSNITKNLDEFIHENYGFLYIRFKNRDSVYFTTDELWEFFKTRKSQNQVVESEKSRDVKQSGIFASYLYERTMWLPTTLGVPIYVTGKLPTFMKFNRTLDSIQTPCMNTKIEATNVYKMETVSPIFKQGVKTEQSLTANTKLDLDYQLRSVSLVQPKFDISSRQTVYLENLNTAKKQEKLVRTPKIEKHTKKFKIFGYDSSLVGNLWDFRKILEFNQELTLKVAKNVDLELSANITENTEIGFDNTEIKYSISGAGNYAITGEYSKIVDDGSIKNRVIQIPDLGTVNTTETIFANLSSHKEIDVDLKGLNITWRTNNIGENVSSEIILRGKPVNENAIYQLLTETNSDKIKIEKNKKHAAKNTLILNLDVYSNGSISSSLKTPQKVYTQFLARSSIKKECSLQWPDDWCSVKRFDGMLTMTRFVKLCSSIFAMDCSPNPEFVILVREVAEKTLNVAIHHKNSSESLNIKEDQAAYLYSNKEFGQISWNGKSLTFTPDPRFQICGLCGGVDDYGNSLRPDIDPFSNAICDANADLENETTMESSEELEQ